MAVMATRAKREDEPERSAERADPAEAGEARVESPRARGRAQEARGPLAALTEGLDEIVPGLEILDRELAFEGGARADLAGVDPSGRLHLVLLAGEDADRAALDTLDALQVLRTQMELLVRHLGGGRVNPERAPRLLVVTPTAEEKLGARLAALVDAGVSVLGLRSVKSASGERTYLVRAGGATGGAGPGGIAAFLRGLPARLEPLGQLLVERMERADEEITASGDGTTVVWRLNGEVLCRVERIGDLLQAGVAPGHEPQTLNDVGDLEKLLARAYARLTHVLKLTRSDAPRGGGPKLARGPDDAPGAEDGPLLTPEEIQAFRE